MRMGRISEAVVLVMLASLPAVAQQAGATANQNVTATAGGRLESNSASAASTANGRSGSVQASGSTNSAAAAGQMHPVNGELQGKLDSKSAKVGDEVVVKTTQPVTTADGTVIPRGSRLEGHVTSVVAHGKESANSQLGIAFDHAELKGGQSLPVHSEIRSLTAPPSVATAGSVDTSMGPGTFGGGGAAGGAMGGGAMSGGRSGGGGLVGGTVGAVGNSAGAVGSSVGGMANSSIRAPGNVAGDVAGNEGGTVQGAGGVAGNAAASAQAHATGVSGVMLAGDATGTASGMLSASKQNVHLDSGTQLVLGIAATQ